MSSRRSEYIEDELNMLEFFRVLKKRKWVIIFSFLVLGIGSLVINLIIPKKYTAHVSLFPISSKEGSENSMAAMASQISNMPVIGSQLSGLTEQLSGNKGKELVNILKSRTLTEEIIKHYNLLPILFSSQWNAETQSFYPWLFKPIPTLEDGVRKFEKKVVDVELRKKTGLIELEVTLKDPILAAKVANRMIIELQDFLNNNAITVEKRNRIFIEEQLVNNRAKLLEAGKNLNEFYAKNKISSVVPEINVNVGSYPSLPKSFEEFRKDIDGLEQQREGGQDLLKNSEETKIVKGVPGQVYLEYLQLDRELLGLSHQLLSQKYELAKIEEAKEDLAFQVIDKAIPPVRASNPKTWLITLLGCIAGIILGIFLALMIEYFYKLKQKEQ